MRIIAKIETKTDYAVKGRKLEGIRNIGDPANLAKRYYEEGADEIFFIDSVASLYGRATLDAVVSKVSETVFTPMSIYKKKIPLTFLDFPQLSLTFLDFL